MRTSSPFVELAKLWKRFIAPEATKPLCVWVSEMSLATSELTACE